MIKPRHFFLTALATIGSTFAAEASLVLTEQKGWFESCYVKWTNDSDFDGYNVYVRPDGGEYKVIDAMLVRNYGTYGRADVVGLKAGDYQLKVVPTKDGVESTADATETSLLSVSPYDRSGFAHFGWNGGVGAYNNDGTLKANARVIYVTKETAKTVTAVVNGTEQTGIQAILDKYEKGQTEDPLAIRIIGKLSLDDLDYIKSKEEGLNLKGKNNSVTVNITIEGIGDDATIWGFGVQFEKTQSVEIRNVAFMCAIDDCLSIKASKHIWVHNNDYFYGSTGGDADQAKGDGSIDVKDNAQYVTYAYNTFWDSGKMSLCGMKSETGPNYITYHHNWFNHSDSRHPRVRTMSVHVYNNYYDGVAKYGVGAAKSSDVFVEGNYFRNCKYPMLSSLQGSDISWGNEGTFSGEAGGIIKAYNNVMVGKYTYVPYGCTKFVKSGVEQAADITTTVDFDAYEVTSRNDKVPSSVTAKSGGHVYNNFDTDASLMYSYTPDSPEDIPAIVTGWLGAGRMGHGDFQWTFNNATEDENYAVITALKSAIVSYTSSLVNFYGTVSSDSNESGSDSSDGSGSSDGSDTGGSGSGDSGSEDGGTSTPTLDSDSMCFFEYENKSLSISSPYFKSTGSKFNAKTGQTVTINGQDYSVGLKLESTTELTLSLPSSATVTFYFDAAASFTLDGEKLDGSSTSYSVDLESGTHTIAKNKNINLYLIVIVLHDEGDGEDGGTITSVKSVSAEALSTSYFNLSGRPCDSSTRGMIVEVTTYSDGSRSSRLRFNK